MPTYELFAKLRYLSLVRLARQLVEDLATAQDVVQTVCAHLRQERPTPIHDPIAYARTAVVEGCRSALRTGRSKGSVELRIDFPDLTEDPAHAGGDGNEQADELLSVIDQLPREQREIVVLCYYEDLSIAEIAATLKISSHAISASHDLAVRTLAAALNGTVNGEHTWTTASDSQPEQAIRRALAGRARTVQPTADRYVAPPPPRRRWLPLAVAVISLTCVVLIGTPLFGTDNSPAAVPIPITHTVDYNAYRGHRWYLRGPSSELTGGWVDLGAYGEITVWNTEQQLIGRYSITHDGQLTVHWTATSSGMVFFDQTVVDAMANFGGDTTMYIRSTTPDTLIIDVAGDRMTFSKDE